jgi:rhodanese-related sulfurtransferase
MPSLLRVLFAALRSGERGPAPVSAPSPPPPPDAIDAPAALLRSAPCLDVRAPDALAAAIVPGAVLLPAADALRLAPRLPRALVVLAGTDAEARTLARALGATGIDAAACIGGISAWKVAGRPLREPAWKSPLPPGHAVTLLPEAARVRGLGERALPGWIQDVAWETAEFRYDVFIDAPDAPPRLSNLPEEALAARGTRGAAGLGGVVSGKR